MSAIPRSVDGRILFDAADVELGFIPVESTTTGAPFFLPEALYPMAITGLGSGLGGAQ